MMLMGCTGYLPSAIYLIHQKLSITSVGMNKQNMSQTKIETARDGQIRFKWGTEGIVGPSRKFLVQQMRCGEWQNKRQDRGSGEGMLHGVALGR